MSTMRLKSPASRLCIQPFIQTQIKKSSKLHIIGLCEGNSPVTDEFPAQTASNAEMFSFDDVIMSFRKSHLPVAIRLMRVVIVVFTH